VEYTIYDMERVNTCVILSAMFNLDLQTDKGLRFRNIGNGLLTKHLKHSVLNFNSIVTNFVFLRLL
jgi:hypothetical protein